MNINITRITFISFLCFIGACGTTVSHTSTQQDLDPSKFHIIRSSLTNAESRFKEHQSGRIAFLGGSITYNGGWRDSVEQYFINRFPKTDFEFIRAGIPSMGSTPSAFRLERDVLSKGTIDLLFQEAAVNDDTNGRSSIEQVRAMEGIVRHLRYANPLIDIVFMHFVDPPKMESYRADSIPVVIKNHERVANHYDISTINLAKEVTERIDNGEFTWDEDFINLHPSPFGQGVYARSIIMFLESNFNHKNTRSSERIARELPKAISTGNYEYGSLVDISMAEYEDGWNVDTNWIPSDGSGTRDNYHHVPMLVSNGTGSLLQFPFEGNTVGIAVAAGVDAGMIEYRVDKGEWQQFNLFTQWSVSLHLPWYYTLESDLTDSKHLLEMKVLEDRDERSKGNACRIRYFYTNHNSIVN